MIELLGCRGAKVEWAENGEKAIDAFSKHPAGYYDAVFMDVMMPELDGFSAVAEIRKVSQAPVLMLSARGEEYDRIHGLRAGGGRLRGQTLLPQRADDAGKRHYEPGAPPGGGPASRNTVSFQGLTIDFDARIVTVDGQRAELSPKEYDLLVYLVQNKNIALTREMLITNVWGYDFYGDDRTLDTHIKLLRKSLGPYSKFIVTLRGVGYRFEVL